MKSGIEIAIPRKELNQVLAALAVETIMGDARAGYTENFRAMLIDGINGIKKYSDAELVSEIMTYCEDDILSEVSLLMNNSPTFDAIWKHRCDELRKQGAILTVSKVIKLRRSVIAPQLAEFQYSTTTVENHIKLLASGFTGWAKQPAAEIIKFIKANNHQLPYFTIRDGETIEVIED